MSYIWHAAALVRALARHYHPVPVVPETFMRPSDFLTRGLIGIAAAATIAQAPLVEAEMIGPEAALQGQSAPSPAEQDRAKVQGFLERANVQQRMQAMGVSGVFAKDRVAALSEEEV